MTASDRIREVLSANPNLSAQEVLRKIKVKCSEALVYLVKRKMDLKPVALRDHTLPATPINSMTLREHILKLLAKKPLSFDEIKEGCRNQGYVSKEKVFGAMLGKRLAALVKSKEILRKDDNYLLEVTQLNGLPEDRKQLLEVHKLCKRLGGVDNVRATLDFLHQLDAVEV